MEWHKKFTLSIACLIFFFIGAPLGSIIRKGGLGLPVVISVVFFIIYHLISTIAERMAVFGDLNMFLGVWFSSLVLLTVGLFFTFKATTDAALVTIDENGNLHPYSFRMCFLDNYLGTVIGTYATKDLGYTKGALFTINGDTNSEAVGQFIEEAYVANGGEFVAKEQCQAGDREFRAQLAKIKRANPDIIL